MGKTFKEKPNYIDEFYSKKSGNKKARAKFEAALKKDYKQNKKYN